MYDCKHLNLKLALVCLMIVLAGASASVSSKAQDTQVNPAATDEQAQQQKHTGKPGESDKPKSQAKTNSARIKKFIPSQQLEADKSISLPANI